MPLPQTAAPPAQPLPRKPEWLRLKLPTDPQYQRTTDLVRSLHLHTVCESAHCPNRWECWSRATATFMVGGDRCTRNCAFCAVSTLKPLPLDPSEPARVGEACARLNLRHVVITMVARDDLQDGASAHVAETIRAARQHAPGILVETLVSDFRGREEDISRVAGAPPDIFSHNIETVRRLTPAVRARATYDRSLDVLRLARARNPGMPLKSGLMLGVGETEDEIDQALRDLRDAGCAIATIGQYLQPSPGHLPVTRWVTPDEFDAWARRATALGFRSVASGPLVRSSYYAERVNLAALRT